MKVLFQSRNNLFDVVGGDTVQILKTKEYLEKLGVTVDISRLEETNVTDYDLVHFFNTTGKIDEIYLKCQKLKKMGLPIVLSPIYWDSNDFWNFYKSYDIRSRLNITLHHTLSFIRDPNVKRLKLLNMADILLPNSEIEKNLIIDKFGISDSKFHIVYNAVDKHFFEADSKSFIDDYGFDDFIMCSGRVEPRKNIHSLIKAVNNTDLRLILVGNYNKDDGYYSYCKKIAGKNIQFLGFFNQNKLSSAYAAAKIHILPSFYETPGLSSLEAAAAGCNIVSTKIGSAKEYFGNLAQYCEPQSVDSIKEAIFNAFNTKNSSKLKERIKKYSWENVAIQTLEGYKMVIN
jgi:glycosyltransferase involved in cell wall biosynthesis